MDATAVFAILGLITALAYVGNPFSDNNNQNKPVVAGGKKSRKRLHRGNQKSRKH
jgi:hypothetical protein